MRKVIYLVFLIISYTAYSQSLSVFNVDATNFPIVKANFIAYDFDGMVLKGFTINDFKVSENGQPRTTTKVTCSNNKPLQDVSLTLSIDISSSMNLSKDGDLPIDLAKITAKELFNSILTPPSEIALQICNSKALIVQDFTTDKSKCLTAIETIITNNENNFSEQLLNRLTGLLNIVNRGKNKKIAVLMTDARWLPLAPNELQTCKDICRDNNIRFYAIVYSKTDVDQNGIKKSLQLLANETGGLMFEGITEISDAIAVAKRLQILIQGDDFCELEWMSDAFCREDETNVEIKAGKYSISAQASYRTPINSLGFLQFTPNYIKFINPEIGIKDDTTVVVNAMNADFNITNVICSNPNFTISSKIFMLKNGQSKNLKISYTPVDSGYEFCKFTFENDRCLTKYYASGGFPDKKPNLKTLKIIEPNGGELLVVGSDASITWEGVLPEDSVKIEYSTDKGNNWIPISSSRGDLVYHWRVPKTPSEDCLARVIANPLSITGCDNNDVQLCDQIWMGCNLDIDHYRNGDLIPQVTDPMEWRALTTGAWCYYNNDQNNGEIYGKLYNWYAINDSRGLAPAGWHIPSDLEWASLVNCIGGEDIAGGKLKSIGTIQSIDGLWESPNKGATNETGFSAVPAGYRYHLGDFKNLTTETYWWTATDFSTKSAYYRRLGVDEIDVGRSTHYYENAFSVRCVKD